MPTGQRLDPAPSFKYGVMIDGNLMAGFTSCSGLEVTRESKPVEEGGINDHVHQLPGPLKQSRLTLKNGLVYSNYMWNWIHAGMYDVKVTRRPITIILYGVDGTAARTWTVADAYPVKWSTGELKSDGNEVAVETVEFVHNGLTFVQGTAPAA